VGHLRRSERAVEDHDPVGVEATEMGEDLGREGVRGEREGEGLDAGQALQRRVAEGVAGRRPLDRDLGLGRRITSGT
jgi:hypothetical protein